MESSPGEVTVGIYVPIRPSGYAGGVEQFVVGLLEGLSASGQPQEYVVITHPEHPDWLEPHLCENMRIEPRPWQDVVERCRAAVGRLDSVLKPVARPIIDAVTGRGDPSVPEDDGFLASLDLDVLHCPTQLYVRSPIPSVYNPHDLQHEHYPDFFESDEIERRRHLYRTGCRDSHAVDVPSMFVREDLQSTYDIDPEKVYPIPRGPPVGLYEPISEEDIAATRRKFDLPEGFAFYPAQTWPHKNHRRLIEAIGYLRENQNVEVPLVCTGRRNEHFESIRATVRECGVTDLVSFLGYVSETELRSLYRLAQFVVIPSLFEGGGFPLLEAWYEGTPVACSGTTSLREKAGDAALLFDPDSSIDIAGAIKTLRTDSERRRHLQKRGTERVGEFNWELTGTVYQALYRWVAGAELGPNERVLLDRSQSGDLP